MDNITNFWPPTNTLSKSPTLSGKIPKKKFYFLILILLKKKKKKKMKKLWNNKQLNYKKNKHNQSNRRQ